MRVLVFGASITQGFWDTQGGWVERLRNYYDKRQLQDLFKNKEPTIFNQGISGDKTTNIISRMANEIEARKWHGEELALVIEIGTNDSYEKNGQFFSSPEEYKERLRQITAIAKKHSNRVMFVGLPSCDEKQTTPAGWDNIYWRNDRLKLFNDCVADICKHEGLPFVPVFEEFEQRSANGEKLFEDGLHPNDAGHQLIFELVRPELDKLLRV